MADLYPVAGAQIYIGGVTATQNSDFSAGDFASETWTEIDGWETAGVVGDAAQLITTQLINRGRDVKQKGTRNAGSMQNNFAEVIGDSGQAAMVTAEAATSNYAFKIEFDDVPSGGSVPTTLYFVGLVTTWQRQNGAANTVRMWNGTIEINSNIVETAAA